MQKFTFSNHFEASPWNKSVIALDARQVVIACSCVCVGHSGRPRACGPRATLVTYTHAAIRNNHLSPTVRGDNYYLSCCWKPCAKLANAYMCKRVCTCVYNAPVYWVYAHVHEHAAVSLYHRQKVARVTVSMLNQVHKVTCWFQIDHQNLDHYQALLQDKACFAKQFVIVDEENEVFFCHTVKLQVHCTRCENS